MTPVLMSFLATLRGAVGGRAALHREILAFRHQLQVLQRSRPRPLRIGNADRWLWAWLSHVWRGWDQAPRYLIHDRDCAFQAFMGTAKAMGIEDVRTAPRSKWQNADVEQFIGSVRRVPRPCDRAQRRGAAHDLERLRAYDTNSRTHLSTVSLGCPVDVTALLRSAPSESIVDRIGAYRGTV